MAKWQTFDGLLKLLKELVSVESMTGEPGEKEMASFLYDSFHSLPYFQKNPNYVRRHPLKDGRELITAFVKKEGQNNTVILLSHFDVVHVEDYGEHKKNAFSVDQLTDAFRTSHSLPKEAAADLQQGDWIFGRGVMDMKAGVALHMSMVEKASYDSFCGNILMISVPDEEVNSSGMLEGVKVLNELREEYGISYTACLNGEPSFSVIPGDENHYIYSGSIGKVLPGFLCFGKETHVGEPFAGLNGNVMASALTQAMEWNTFFCEQVNGETTPPPVNLQQKDLKDHYSVQIPHASVCLFNIMLMEKPLQMLQQELLAAAKQTALDLEKTLRQRREAYAAFTLSQPVIEDIKVMAFHDLFTYASRKFGEEEVNALLESVKVTAGSDAREQTTAFALEIASKCRELAPMMVLFFAPPFYPAVSSHTSSLVQNVFKAVKEKALRDYGNQYIERTYFNGLSDLSYVGFHYSNEDLKSFTENFPLWGKGYEIPVDAMQLLNIPVLNIGPFGKDAHQWTERLNAKRAFTETKKLLAFSIEAIFSESCALEKN